MTDQNEQAEEKTVIAPDTSEYKDSKTAKGNKSQICGDPVSLALEGMTIGEVKSVAKELGFDEVDKYNHLNVGQQRMNLGNRIRGIVNAMENETEKDEEGVLIPVGKDKGLAKLALVAEPYAEAAADRIAAAEKERAEKKAKAETAKAEKAAKIKAKAEAAAASAAKTEEAA